MVTYWLHVPPPTVSKTLHGTIWFFPSNFLCCSASLLLWYTCEILLTSWCNSLFVCINYACMFSCWCSHCALLDCIASVCLSAVLFNVASLLLSCSTNFTSVFFRHLFYFASIFSLFSYDRLTLHASIQSLLYISPHASATCILATLFLPPLVTIIAFL